MADLLPVTLLCPQEEVEEDSDLSDYGDDVDGKKDSLAEPCFMLIGEIFELRGSKPLCYRLAVSAGFLGCAHKVRSLEACGAADTHLYRCIHSLIHQILLRGPFGC